MAKNYSVTQLVKKSDESEVLEILKRFPLWKKRDARELVARRKFQASINAAK